MMMQGQYALVTGGSRGIGRAIVEEFARQGANVLFTYRSQEGAAQDLKSTLESQFPDQTFMAIQCDASSEQDIEKLCETHLEGVPSLDILVNNAGITRDGLMVTMGSDQWRDVIDTNLTGVFLLTRKVAYKMLLQRKGSIVTISSVAGVYGNAGQTNYSAAKAGLIGMSKSLSKEMAARNIRVNVVAPGFIETDMTAYLSDKDKKDLLTKVGMKKMGQVEDVAQAVSFLASDKAKYITGQTLVVDGGLVI